MRSLTILLVAIVVTSLVACQPLPPPTKLQPNGGVLGKVGTQSDTQSSIKAWGEGANSTIAFWEAKNAGAKAMIKDTAKDVNQAMNDSGWKQIVERTCKLDMNSASVRNLPGGVRWEGQVICQRQEILDWLNERKYGMVGTTKKIVLPKLCLVPSRMFGNIDDLELSEDEKFVKNAALELLRDRDSGFQIDDYETLIRGWSSVRGQVSGDIDINPQFAVEADVYIKFNIKVETGRYLKASGTFEAIFVSTGKTVANSVGFSKDFENQPTNRSIAIMDCAKHGIDQIYDDMMKNWKEELENGFYYRIYFTGVDNKFKGKIYKALVSLKPQDGYNPTQNKFSNGNLDMSIYVRDSYAEPMLMFDALNDALMAEGLQIEDTMLELRHALGYKIGVAE